MPDAGPGGASDAAYLRRNSLSPECHRPDPPFAASPDRKGETVPSGSVQFAPCGRALNGPGGCPVNGPRASAGPARQRLSCTTTLKKDANAPRNHGSRCLTRLGARHSARRERKGRFQPGKAQAKSVLGGPAGPARPALSVRRTSSAWYGPAPAESQAASATTRNLTSLSTCRGHVKAKTRHKAGPGPAYGPATPGAGDFFPYRDIAPRAAAPVPPSGANPAQAPGAGGAEGTEARTPRLLRSPLSRGRPVKFPRGPGGAARSRASLSRAFQVAALPRSARAG